MLRLDEIRLPIERDGTKALKISVCKRLGIRTEDITAFTILRRSIDARRKPRIDMVYSVAVAVKNEAAYRKRHKNRRFSSYQPRPFLLPAYQGRMKTVAVVGAGPAGLFAAYVLAKAGLSPIVLERGKPVEQRRKDVLTFLKSGVLDPDSNVVFGEGGAGTFSDGKLNTSVKDKTGRHRFVLETFVSYGAKSSILYDAKPHIGTDVLAGVIAAMRDDILRMGGSFYYSSTFQKIHTTAGRLTAIETKEGQYIETDALILAMGHSARDTFLQLYEQGVPMEAKAFAVGFRVEHPQEMIDRAQYGIAGDRLPAAPYKLVAKDLRRPVYSFCMCPGGYVINSSSEEGLLCVNGMSYEARDGSNANSAIVLAVGEGEYDRNDPMAAIAYQRALERKAYLVGDGAIPQQLLGDYRMGHKSTSYGAYQTAVRGQTKLSNLRGILSEELEEIWLEGMRRMESRIPGFFGDETILSGVESRTSSPIRILRDANCESEIAGLFPCGEGAGYAGGIASAAMDGIRVAEALINKLNNEETVG